MKILKSTIKTTLSILCMLVFTTNVNGQLLKKLGEKAQKAAERTVERRVEKETQKKTDAALDSILEPGKKKKTPVDKKGKPIPQGNETNNPSNSGSTSEPENSNTQNSDSEPKSVKVYSKFDFVPGDKLLFFDNFSNDFIGDFPAKWNTNGTGEIITIDDSPDRWMEIISGYGTYYVPDVPTLPEDYTIEFDLFTIGVDKKTSSSAHLEVYISDDPKFKRGKNNVKVNIPFSQSTPVGIRAKNYENNSGGDINNMVKADIRNAVINQPHISIAVNKQRYRLWVNEKKYLDIPRMIAETSKLTTLKFALQYIKDGKEQIFISNLKVAEGGVDLRRKLLSEGKVSTNGILFDTGSANIQPQSMGIIRQISQVLQQDASINLKIIGHTDADGGDETNMELSKNRAEAVMNALITIYNASPDRLTSGGMGESQPVSDNNTTDGKAQNRRVEFIKQ